MAAPPKAKASPGSSASRAPSPTSAPADRTSTVVSWTLISLTVLGVLTVFWEPLAALAGAGPGGGSTAAPSVTSAPSGSQSGPLDGSASS